MNSSIVIHVSMAAAILSTTLSSHAAKPSLTLVAEDRCRCVIVTADRPTKIVSESAVVLADHLDQITGRRPSIVAESSLSGVGVRDGKIYSDGRDSSTVYLLVGTGTLASRLGITAEGLGPGGIRLKTTGNTIVMLGAGEATPVDPNGSMYAVTEFLRGLGVRYLWPGESGKVVPHRTELRVGPLDLRYTPLLWQRRIRDLGYNERIQVGLNKIGVNKEEFSAKRIAASRVISTSPSWFTWNGLGGNSGLVTGHAFGSLWKKYGQAHPDWFALQANGSRDQSSSPSRARLCESNLQLQEAIALEKIAELNRNPSQTSVSIDQNDGGEPGFCLCPECRKLDPPDGKPVQIWEFRDGKIAPINYVSLTDRMVYFWNGIAERVTKAHPHALLTVRAYSAYTAPPVRLKLHPNLVVEHVSANYRSTISVAKRLEEWEQWANVAPRLAWRPNVPEVDRGSYLPMIFVHRMAADVKARAHNHMFTSDVDGCMHNWATGGLNLYALARLLWNPDEDIDALVDDYCSSGFGAAAPQVKRYFARLEELTYEFGSLREQDPNSTLTMADVYDTSRIVELRRILDAADRLVSEDKPVQARLHFLRIGLEFTAVQAEGLRLAQQNAKVPVASATAGEYLQRRDKLIRKIFDEHTLAVSIPYMLYRSETEFQALRARASKTASAVKTRVDADDEGRPEVQEKTGP